MGPPSTSTGDGKCTGSGLGECGPGEPFDGCGHQGPGPGATATCQAAPSTGRAATLRLLPPVTARYSKPETMTPMNQLYGPSVAL